MSTDIYSLTPLNLALDGTLESFLEAYRSIYEVYLRKVRETPTLINVRSNLDASVIPEILPILDFLLFKRLRIFTTDFKHLSLREHHVKRFSFLDESKLEEFARTQQLNLEWKKEGFTSLVDERYLELANDEFLFLETAIDFEQFLKEVQRVVVRTICEEKQKEDPEYKIFDARVAVENRIAVRMKQRRGELILPKDDRNQPTAEPLYVYDRLSAIGCKKNAHTLDLKKYYARQKGGQHMLAISTHYCENCRRYLIGSQSLSLFREFGGDFIAQIYRLNPGSEYCFDALGESKLHKLGYNVIDGNLSKSERENILMFVIESRQLTFFEVVATIEQNIIRFENNPRMQKAVTKWRNDLQFINTYALTIK